jgi:hypothetical protein
MNSTHLLDFIHSQLCFYGKNALSAPHSCVPCASGVTSYHLLFTMGGCVQSMLCRVVKEDPTPSEEATAEVLQHLFNVITALEATIENQGVSLSSSGSLAGWAT